MSTEQNNQGKDAKKVLNQFDTNIKKLTAILRGPENLTTVNKIKTGGMASIVAELFKEDSKATEEEVKEGLRSNLKNYVSLNKALAEERKKLDNIEIQKKKEFNISINKLFNKIEGVDDILKEYQEALVIGAEAVPEVNRTPEIEE